MFKPDVPIKNSTADLLQRQPFAISLAEAILKYEELESVVIGLYGKWGSGKSSVINMCIECIEDRSREWHDESKPILIKFNPWNFSDQNQLISQFFIQLSVGIRRIDKGEGAVKIANKLEAYSAFFLPLELVPDPVIGPAAALTSKVMKRTSAAVRSWGELRKKDLEATRDEIEHLLRTRGQKVLIFIDDIDRLTGTEIRQIFQLVKLLGDFSNTIYLLSLDDEVVVEALKPVQPGVGTEYLEKIIQVPFRLPAIDSDAVHKFLIGSINRIINDVPENLSDPTYFGNIFHRGFKNLFITLRDVIRFINVLQFGFEPIKNDVNAVDFIALTALQVFEPEVYKDIASNRSLFTGLGDSFKNENSRISLKNECDAIIIKAKRITKDELSHILRSMFPKLQKIYDNRGYDNSALRIWRRQGRACSPEKFDIYFRLCIASQDISEAEMVDILSSASDPMRFSLAIQQLVEQNRINRFLQRIYDYVQHDIAEENIPNIFQVLLDLGDTFPDEEGFRGFGVSLSITQILTYLLDRIESQERRYQIIYEAFMAATNSLNIMLAYVYSLGWNHGKWIDEGRELEPEDRRIVSPARLATLEELALGKIYEWAKSGKLTTHRDLLFILYKWRDLAGGVDEPRAFVSSLTSDRDGTIHIVCAFSGKLYLYGLEDYVAKEKIHINMDPYRIFSDPKLLADQVRPIIESSSVSVTPDRRRILKAFLNNYDESTKSGV